MSSQQQAESQQPPLPSTPKNTTSLLNKPSNAKQKFVPKSKNSISTLNKQKYRQKQRQSGKWKANDEVYQRADTKELYGEPMGGPINGIGSNVNNKKKICMSALVDRMLAASSSQFQAKIMEDWIKSSNRNK